MSQGDGRRRDRGRSLSAACPWVAPGEGRGVGHSDPNPTAKSGGRGRCMIRKGRYGFPYRPITHGLSCCGQELAGRSSLRASRCHAMSRAGRISSKPSDSAKRPPGLLSLWPFCCAPVLALLQPVSPHFSLSCCEPGWPFGRFPFAPAGLRAALRPFARPRFGPSSLTARLSALLLTYECQAWQ